MSVNVTSVTNHYPTANKGFITTTSSTITSGVAQTTVPLTSVAGLTNGTIFVGILSPGTTAEREFTGTVDTAGSQITDVKWTDGTDGTHTAGTTIVDYVSATGQNMQTKGFLVAHDQDGTLKADSVDVTAVIKDAIVTPAKLTSRARLGWFDSELPAVSSVTNNGNRSYTIPFASTVASILSEGMRLEFTKTVAGNGYMGGAFNGSSHYFTKTSPSGTLGTVTNNFTIEAVVQPTSYAQSGIACRMDATPNNGFQLYMEASGQVSINVFNSGTANFRRITTYQSLPLDKKTHVAASWTSGTVLIFFDGKSVPVQTAATGGTAPTTAGTGGDFSIGRPGAFAGQYWSGYISNVAVFDAVVTPATIRQHATYKLLGSETNCIGAWSLDNTANDQSSAGNNLTATGGVGYTAMSPHGQLGNGVETTKAVGLVMAVSGTDVTVQVPEGVTIPTTGGITSVAYSTFANPFGFVSDKGRWGIRWVARTSTAQSSPVSGTWYNLDSTQLTIPAGKWLYGYEACLYITRGNSSGTVEGQLTISTANNSTVDSETTSAIYGTGATSGIAFELLATLKREKEISVSTPTVYYLNGMSNSAGGTTLQLQSARGATKLYALPAGL